MSDHLGTMVTPTNLTTISDPFQGPDIVLVIVLSLIALCGAFGNALVVVAIYKTRALHTVTNYFIVSLACADLFVSTCIMPFAVVTQSLNGRWLFGQVFCSIWSSLDILCCTASTLNLCAVSVDRYIAITSPLKYHISMTRGRALAIICVVWLFSMFLATTQLIWKQIIGQTSEVMPGFEICPYALDKTFRMYAASSSFFIPLTIVIILYARIFRVAYKQARQINATHDQLQTSHPSRSQIGRQESIANGNNNAPSNTLSNQLRKASRMSMEFGIASREVYPHRQSRETKAFKTVAAVLGAFIICWIPFAVTFVVEAYCSKCNLPVKMMDTFLWLGYVNSVVNPIIYAFFNRTFRTSFIRVLGLQSRTSCCGHTFDEDDYRSTMMA
ncbi:D(2)-like dopamine receptor [Lytechinus variegatus]|uniref:D(2)-like dopamine receptor n=1 Tax=Lytechinus variegatus TaxID=7654 RepID=UPI001BB23137|nr:D(2)-like dopamine receptor [Lytechinus variegatus]